MARAADCPYGSEWLEGGVFADIGGGVRADRVGVWDCAPCADRVVDTPGVGRASGGLVDVDRVYSAYVPANHFKSWVGHPMALSAGVWAFGHLLANGTLNAVVLFGAFLIWSVLDFAAGRRRDDAAGVVYPAGAWGKDLVAVVVGVVVWVLFVGWLHVWLIGVRPGV
jgi:hypothetical protein